MKLVFKNLFRHRLRTALTIVGIATAVMAFGLIRTIVGAWNAGVTGAAANRMITRHRVSLIFPIPLPYRNEIARVPGVTAVSWANWFGGVYGEPNDFKNFWPRFAVDPHMYFDLYPEFQVPPDQLAAFKKERNACIIGRKLAQQHGFKLGDVITMEGDIYPGSWQWVVRGIYTGRDPSTDETQMFFQFAYLYEQVRAREPGRPVDAGFYVLRVGSPDAMARVAAAIDTQFVNSRAPTKTESEREFQQSFVQMSSAIITSLQVISVVIVGIILLVLANTIIMSVRERTREYAVLKTLGFSGRHLGALVVFVFAGVLMLARGLEATLVETGSADNVIVLRRSATSELSSQIDRATADALEAENGVARAGDGRALLSRDVMLIINLYKKKSGALGNVSTRGVSAHALEVRHGVRIIQGRPFQFGTHEIVVGKSIASRFKGVALGAELAFAGDRWTIVGIMDAGGTGFDSEIWGDADQFMQAAGRPVYSSLTFRLAEPARFDQLKARLQADPRFQSVELKHERDYYKEQSQTLAKFIRILGL